MNGAHAVDPREGRRAHPAADITIDAAAGEFGGADAHQRGWKVCHGQQRRCLAPWCSGATHRGGGWHLLSTKNSPVTFSGLRSLLLPLHAQTWPLFPLWLSVPAGVHCDVPDRPCDCRRSARQQLCVRSCAKRCGSAPTEENIGQKLYRQSRRQSWRAVLSRSLGVTGCSPLRDDV